MSAYPDRDLADELVRKLVRKRQFCANCANYGTDTAHIIPRRFNLTRCDERNLLFLCRQDHDRFDGRRRTSALFRSRLIEDHLGAAEHAKLRLGAYKGPQGPLRSFWADEVERLMKRLVEEGIEP